MVWYIENIHREIEDDVICDGWMDEWIIHTTYSTLPN